MKSGAKPKDLVAEKGEGECDFATDVAAAHPLRILSTMLGVPRESEPDILRLTNQLFASDDPDLQREGTDRRQAIEELGLEFYQLFGRSTFFFDPVTRTSMVCVPGVTATVASTR